MRKGALNLFSKDISSSSSMLAKESNVDGTPLVLIFSNINDFTSIYKLEQIFLHKSYMKGFHQYESYQFYIPSPISLLWKK